MDITYRHNAQNNYVVLKDDKLILKDYRLNMVLKNDISGILKVYASCIDGRTELSYVISSKESIKDLYEKNKMTFDDILNVLKATIQTCYTVQNYLLRPEDLLLEPDLVFYDYYNKGISFCYFPNSNRDLKYELRNFVEKLMLITEHKDRKGVELIYGVFSICNKREFLVKDIEEYVKDFEQTNTIKDGFESESLDYNEFGYYNSDDSYLQENQNEYHSFVCENPGVAYNTGTCNQDMKSILKNNTILKKITDVFGSKNKVRDDYEKTSERISEKASKECKKVKNDNYNYYMDRNAAYDFRNENDEVYEDFNDNTMYIKNHMSGDTKTLFSLSKQKNISIKTNPFIIGKLSSRVDFVIEDNTVSRIHLKIIREGNEYYIEDMNSKNGTYLNGIQAEPHEKIKIETGDKIRIAGYEYVFK